MYPIVRSDQNWAFLANPANRTDSFDSLEYVPLGAGQPSWFASFGLEVRETYESIQNDYWSSEPRENDSFQQRYLLITDFHLGPHFRTFLEFKSNFEAGRIGGPRPIDVSALNLLAAFVEAKIGSSPSSPSVRVGREELFFGSGRLVAPREGPNVRNSFTGIRAQNDVGDVHLDALYVHPDGDNPGVFDDNPQAGTELWGLYASDTARKFGVDLYYLGIHRLNDTIARGTANETRHSIGVRVYEPFSASRSGLDLDDELIYQTGVFGLNPISAWSISTATGWHFGPSPLSPHLLLRLDTASGDDPRRKTVGTFDPYYAAGNYLGVLNSTGPGPVNFEDIHPSVSTILGPVMVTANWLWYWRESTMDGLYGIPGNLIRAPLTSTARFVGQLPGLEATWQINAHLYLQGDYGGFSAGPFIADTGPANTLVYRSIWLGYKF
jgi:hypothetical protein